jgi:hypothetical protein
VRRGGERPPLRDGAAARELVLGWTSAFNRRDADALVALADAEIAYYPTILARGPRVYRGHEGLRAWLADLARAKAHHTVAVADVRVSPGGQLLVFGQIVEDDEPISPFSMLMRARRRLVIEAHVYLSDEAMMQTLGRVD